MSGGGSSSSSGSNPVTTAMAKMIGSMASGEGTTSKSVASLPSNPGAATLVDTGATPPSGSRPIGPTQFYQPVYHPSYQNYRLPSTPDVSAYGVNMQNPFAYQPHNFQPTMPTAQQAMGPLPQGLPPEVASQGIAALQSQQK